MHRFSSSGGTLDSVSKRRIGTLAEAIAARFLELEGYQILARNTRRAEVEIDLLARHNCTLIVVEVKLRSRDTVPATQALRPLQGRRLRRAAQALLESNNWAEAVRIDVVALQWQARSGYMTVEHLYGVEPR